MTQAEPAKERSESFWDTLQFLHQAARTVAAFVYSGSGRHLGQCQRDLSWYISAWIPAHTAATC